jgi:predicted GH43/DUF377 family glycosyl hydrolase
MPKKRKKGSPKKKSKKKPGKQKRKKTSSLFLVKSLNGPIISPDAENAWQAWQTFNAGVILLEDRVHFLYRAIGGDAISRLGYAVSSDGVKIDERLPQAVYEHPLADSNSSFHIFSFVSGGSFGGCEDPRPVRVNKEDTLYLTYTACDQGLRIVLTSIKIEDFLNKKWLWKQPVFISPPGQVHKNWVIFPEKIKGRYAILHSLNPKISVDYFDSLEFDGQTYINSHYNPIPQGSHWTWEGWIRGVGPPPLKTKEGWLVLYHAQARHDPGKYKVGAMLLDLEDPSKVLHCSKEPIIEASKLYENNGYKPGVVYASGAVVKDGLLLVYYGAADSYVCVAYADFEEFLKVLKKETKPKLARRSLERK